MRPNMPSNDFAWSSNGLPPVEAFRRWQRLACEMLTPMQIDIPDKQRFAARWRSHALGPLRIVELEATSQRVVHSGDTAGTGGESTMQLLFCRRTPISARAGTQKFRIDVGDFVLLDHALPYEIRMADSHAAILVLAPCSWLQRWLPDPLQCVGRPFSTSRGWGPPLASLLSTMTSEIDSAPLPRTMIADQLGALLALAVGAEAIPVSGHRARLVYRLLREIEERHGDPGLNPGAVAKELGISKRYLHTLLAERGMTFLSVLSRIRLDRASELLADPRHAGRQIAEVSWTCGYPDPSYFARVFRRRFGIGPRAWRAARLQ